MLMIVGALVVSLAVLGGYLMEGGHAYVLFQPVELLIIGGAAGGSLLISCPPPMLKRIFRQVFGALMQHEINSQDYLDLLKCLFDVCKQFRADPLSLESHLEKPSDSAIFKRYPSVLKNHHALDFLCDTLKIQVSCNPTPYDLEDLMDTDLNSAHEEEHGAPAAITRIGDAMPGLGIVAAVLGVVITMGKLAQGKEVIGHSVAAALVGTFLGILASYGFMQPLAAKMETVIANEGKYIQVIKVGILALAKGNPPKVCVEFARRTVSPDTRPTFDELDKATSNNAGAAKAA